MESDVRRAFLCLPLALVGGCVSPRRDSRLDPTAVSRVVATVAVQVRRCYRPPPVSHAGRQISTRLRVRYGPDGTPTGIPLVLAQNGVTPDNQPYAGAMAEAAIESVLRCSPLHLPAELYPGGWDELELTFSPSARA